MAILQKIRNRLGWYSPTELEALIEAKAHPALGALLSDASHRDTGRGIDPEDQDFRKFLKSPGLFGWVETCIDARAKAAAAVPLRLMGWKGGEPEPIEDHPLLDLMNDPNPEQGFYSFWYGLHQQLGYCGEAYISTDAPFSAQTDELWSLRADQMAPHPMKGPGGQTVRRTGKEAQALSHWIYRSDTRSDVRLETDQVIQVREPHPTDQWRGLSPLKKLNDWLYLEWAILKSTGSYFANGARPSCVMYRRGKPSKDEIERWEQKFSHGRAGVENVGKVWIFWGEDTRLDTISQSPIESGSLELLERSKAITLSVYKCPPFVVGLPDGTTWSNSREQKSFFYQNAIIPANRLILDTINASPLVKAFARDQDSPDLWFEHDYSGIEALQPDLNEQSTRDVAAIKVGLRTINEVRAERSYGEPYDWGDAPPAPANPFADLAGDKAAPEAAYWDLIRQSRRLKAAGKKGDARALLWKGIDQRQQPIVRAWIRKVRPLFDEMRDDVLRRMGEEQSPGAVYLGLQPTTEELQKALAGNGAEETKASDDVVPFDWTLEEWIDIPQTVEGWADHLRSLADKTLETGAEDTLQQVEDTFVPFDVTSPEVAAWIENRMATQIRTIAENRQADVRQLVTDAAAEGRTIGQLERDLRDKFDRNNRAWSTRIARTETAGLYNQGAVEGLREAGIEFKEWLSSRDIDVRTTHAAVDGTSIPLDANFTVGDATGPAPGQMSTAKETCNCRCALTMGEMAHGPED